MKRDGQQSNEIFRFVLQESELQLRRHGSRAVLVDLELPHLVRLEEDPLRTEIMLYRIMVSNKVVFVLGKNKTTPKNKNA